MAFHKIVIDPFDSSSIVKAEEEYRKLLEEFDKKVEVFLRRVAESAAKVAQTEYGSGVTVSVKQIDGGYVVNANGKAVVFLEFGAGLMTDSSDIFAKEVDFPVYVGSYSELASSSHEFYKTGKWHFGGKEYTYIVPKNAMQKAYESVAQSFGQIAKEVFG